MSICDEELLRLDRIFASGKKMMKYEKFQELILWNVLQLGGYKLEIRRELLISTADNNNNGESDKRGNDDNIQ